MTTAPQNLHFEPRPCNHFECMLYYWQKKRRNASSIRCASSRINRLWPHLWPSTASDYVDAVCYEALKSTDFRYESIENHPKVLILQGFYGSGPRGRGFESNFSHHGPLVKRLRHGPFTAVTWVRFPYGSPNVTNPNYFVNRNWFGFVFYYIYSN